MSVLIVLVVLTNVSSYLKIFITLLILEIEKKIYKTEEHPSVAVTMHSIADQLSNLGEYQKAHDHFVSVLGILSRMRIS